MFSKQGIILVDFLFFLYYNVIKIKEEITYMDKKAFKKTSEELQQYLQLMRKHLVVPSKKGKGSFKRCPKHKGGIYN